MSNPKAYTVDEELSMLLEQLYNTAEYWARLPGKTPQERCHGLVFSILNLLDGYTGFFPAYDIRVAPHPDDKEFHIQNGERWHKPGLLINGSAMLHEMYIDVEKEHEKNG